jgi:hypothetical protein
VREAAPVDRVVAALRAPRALAGLSEMQWELLVRQARAAGLLARIAVDALEQGIAARLPAAPRAHLDGALSLVAAQREEVEVEVAELADGLAPLGQPVVLLKGAAYVAAGLPAARGRMFSDIDILVPRAALAQVESALLLRGWATTHQDAYDQRYYREWVHELPPMQHIQRGTVLDVHHAIVSPAGRTRPDSARLLAAALPLRGHPCLHVLAPADMVLHAMTHLTHNEEFSHGLRDLSDLDLLLRHFGAHGGFWDALVARAGELGLGRPLFYGLAMARARLETPVPQGVVERVAAFAPPVWTRAALLGAFDHALRSPHPSAAGRLRPAALALLFLRSHWLRMPLPLLARHLAHKATKRRSAADRATI